MDHPFRFNILLLIICVLHCINLRRGKFAKNSFQGLLFWILEWYKTRRKTWTLFWTMFHFSWKNRLSLKFLKQILAIQSYQIISPQLFKLKYTISAPWEGYVTKIIFNQYMTCLVWLSPCLRWLYQYSETNVSMKNKTES